MNTIHASNVFSFDFKTGKMKPITAAGLLPVGSIVTYEDCKNPETAFVVTGADFAEHSTGQECICEDGHRSHVSKDAVEGPGGWQLKKNSLTGEPLISTDDEIRLFLLNAEKRKASESAERVKAAQTEAERQATAKADYLARFPYLARVAPGSYASAKLGAANIRQELKRAFPGVKFSVTSDTFSGGDSIDVRWTLGPTTKEIEAVIGKYQEGDFDGMEDIYNHDRSNVWPELFGGAKYVHESRSDGTAYAQIAGQLCDLWSIPRPDSGQYWDLVHEKADDVRETTRALLAVTSLPAGVDAVTAEHMPGTDRNPSFAEYYGNKGFGEFYRLTFTAPDSKSAPAANVDAPQAVSGVTVTENDEKDGVEVRFPAKPDTGTIEALKAHGFRWTRFGACWYHKRTPQAVAFAQSLIPAESVAA